MRSVARAGVALAMVWSLVAACGSTVTPTSEPTAAPTATPAPTAPAVAEVSGSTGTCGQDGDYTVCDNGTASDERVVGTSRYATDCEMTVDGDTTVATCSFPITLTNAGGTWEGTMEGTSTWSVAAPEHVHVFDATYLGTGAYEGLRYVQHVEGLDYPWSFTGRIEPAG
jgi:hypothetical protein